MEVTILKGPLVDNDIFLNLQSLFQGLVNKKSGMKFNFINPDLEYEEGLDDEEVEELNQKKLLLIEGESTLGGSSFDTLFNQSKGISFDHNIKKTDVTIFLTGKNNNRNYLSYCDENIENVFIYTRGWNRIYERSNDIVFPLAYEITSWALRKLMFQTEIELYLNIHFNVRGCVNDMCEDITNHSFKSRTGDICKDCLTIVRDKSISNKYLKEINRLNDSFAGFIKTREKIISSDEELTLELSPLNNNKVFKIPELGNAVIEMEPLWKAIYLLFILHPNGIIRSKIRLFKNDLSKYISEMGLKTKDPIKVEESLNKTLSSDKLDNLNIIISKINSAISDVIPGDRAKEFQIIKDGDDKSKITFNRTNFINVTKLVLPQIN
jgi:hypothetical protein